MLFDTHAHYDDEAFDPDRELLLESLPQRGVALVLNPGCDLDSSRKAVSYAAAYPHVYAAVGIHPENCAGFVPADIDVLRELARQPKVAAIGEIGLDYYWAENPPRELQQQVLRAQLALARALRLPVIFHDREAHGDSLAIVREFPDVTGVFHCFSGSPEMARELLDLGWYLGFDGPVTYKNARRAAGFTQEAAAEQLGLSVESIRAYETGQRVPPNDVVEQMVICYNAQRLAYQHLHETNALMSRVVPALEQRSVLEAAVRIYNRMARFQREHGVERLMAIAEDGQIDQGERQEFEAIMEDIRDIVKSGLELEVFCGKEEP